MRVLVMRPLSESAGVAAALIARGHEPVIAPLTSIVPLPVGSLPPSLDAVLLTSQHAAAALTNDMRDAIRPLPAYAVGATTATAAQRCGFTEVRVGAGDAAALLDLIRLTLPRGAHLLYLAGRVRKPLLPELLDGAGYRLTIWETYDAQPVADWAATVTDGDSDSAFAACLHFSRRGAELACAASRGGPLQRLFDAAAHHCLSVDVASPLRAAGLPQICIAPSPTLASLLQGFSRSMA